MKNIIILFIPIFILTMIVGCSNICVPYSQIYANKIISVRVGVTDYAECLDMFSSGTNSNIEDPIMIFTHYFTVTNKNTVGMLCDLVDSMNKSNNEFITMIGVLSEQRFLDSENNVLIQTHIVNFGNTVVFEKYDGIKVKSRYVSHSKEFCKVIYELMCQYSPGKIEEQQSRYKRIGQKLEDLLFEAKYNE